MDENTIGNFCEAIRDEIQATRRRGGVKKVPVANGKKQREDKNGGDVYSFSVPYPVDIKEESFATLEFGGRQVSATILAVSKDRVSLGLPEDISIPAGNCMLIVDDIFILERLKETLEGLGDDKVGFRYDMADQLFGNCPENVECREFAGYSYLNVEQRRAAGIVLGSDIAFVWGPPGTGKTATMAAAVAEMAKAGLRVLVVSNTNRAVDGILERICGVLKGHKVLESGRIVRLGAISENLLESECGQLVSAEALVRRFNPDLFAAMDDSKELKSEAAMEATRLCEQFPDLALLGDLMDLKAKRSLSGGNDDPSEIVGIEERIRTAEESLSMMRGGDGVRLAYSSARAEAEKHGSALRRLEAKAEEASKKIVSSSAILAATAYQTFLRPSWFSDIDVVVVEEGSMLPLPVVYYVAGLAQKKIAVSGDFRQLPPVAQANTDLSRKWFARDIFSASGIASAVNRGNHPGNLTLLQDQYRMAPEICELINGYFYGGALRSPPRKPSEARKVLPGSVFFVDTGSLSPWTGFAKNTGSKFNVVNALVAAGLFDSLGRKGYEEKEGDRIGIISPYAAQARFVRSLVGDGASTVHRYQGDERDTILFDVTEAGWTRAGIFYNGSTDDEIDGRLLNVAISRARDHFVLIGEDDWLNRKAEGALNAVYSQIRESARRIDARSALERGLGRDREFRLASGDSPELAILEDIKGARRSVLIVAAQISCKGLDLFGPDLKRLSARGIPVRMYAAGVTLEDEIEEMEVEDWLSQLRAANIKVSITGERAAGSAVIVDEERVWAGSQGCFGRTDRDPVASCLGFSGRNSARILEALLVDEREAEGVLKRSATEFLL